MPRKVNPRSVRRKYIRQSSPKKKIRKKYKKKSRSRSRSTKSKPSFCYRKKTQKKTNHNLAKYVKEVSNEVKTCQIMTPHGNIIDLPNEYPGDDFVFAELYTNPEDKYHTEMVESSILRDVYDKYHRMCF